MANPTVAGFMPNSCTLISIAIPGVTGFSFGTSSSQVNQSGETTGPILKTVAFDYAASGSISTDAPDSLTNVGLEPGDSGAIAISLKDIFGGADLVATHPTGGVAIITGVDVNYSRGNPTGTVNFVLLFGSGGESPIILT